VRFFLYTFTVITLLFTSVSAVSAQTPTPKQATTPTPSLLPVLPTITITPVPCSDDKSIYPPNSECYPEVKAVEINISDYPLTCITAPNVIYKDTYTGDSAPFFIDINITHNFSEAALGSFGPSQNTIATTQSPDNLSKKYLFSGLFDKPYYSLENTPREAWRTYWRLLTARQQANVKAAYLKEIGKQQKNVTWHYTNKNGDLLETTAKELLDDLPDCLTKVPVCDDYVEKYTNLSKNLKLRYDTLQPFDFDNLRSYIVLGSQVIEENIPYLQAILSGISGEYGLFSHLTPSWAVNNQNEIATTTNESSLFQKIISRGAIISCSSPVKTASLPAPKTFSTPPTAGQTVRVPVTAKEIGHEPSVCGCTRSKAECAKLYCQYYTSEKTCKPGCTWKEGETEYELSGEATGLPLAVLNNPKVKQVTDMVLGNSDQKIPSFFRMLLPSFAKDPEKVLISAPSVGNTTNPEAVVNGGSSIIRENNLAQDSIHLLQSCWFLPSEGQSSSKCGKHQEEVGSCNGELMKQIVGNPPEPSSTATSYFSTYILPNLTDEVVTAYAAAETATGVPCEVLAGIHFEEGDNDPGKSLQDGSPLSGSLIDSAIRAGNELKGKVGGKITNLNALIQALSWYNGGGNSNCQDSSNCAAAASLDRCGLTVGCATDPSSCMCTSGFVPEPGSCRASCDPNSFPWTFSYNYCPTQTTGFDDPYVTNWWQSPQHNTMYLLYQYDCTRTRPLVHVRPGSLTVALSAFFYEMK